jgi:hypothetical protein
MIRLANFPENASAPVTFEYSAAFPWLAADVTTRVLDDLAVVEESISVSEIPIVTGRVRHLPSVNDVTLKIDEIDIPAPTLRCEQCQSRESPVYIKGTQAGTETLRFDLFDRCHEFVVT